jgi:hypothetical protein
MGNKFEREWYSLSDAAEILSCRDSDLIHAGAIGQIPIYAMASNWILEPFAQKEDGSIIRYSRMIFSKLVQIRADDLFAYEGSRLTAFAEEVILPPVDGQKCWAHLLVADSIYDFDLQRAYRFKRRIADMKLVIKADDLKALQTKDKQKATEEQQEPSTKRKNTYLLLISALLKQAGIDPNDRGIAAAIGRLLEERGTPMDPKTIRSVLDEIPDALESRQK